MAFYLAPRALARYARLKEIIIRNMSIVKQSDTRDGKCSVPDQLACPPCEPAPRPACRPTEPAHKPRGMRHVCCAPSAGKRPPCTPSPTVCPKTCRHANEQKNEDSCRISKCRSEKCGDNLDRVAKRLAAAELTRRLDYEREVAKGEPMTIPNSIAYNLVDERECIRATDGHDYTASKQSNTQTRCGPCRTPPPPCQMRLEPDDNCKIKSGQYLEPCAHQPRIFIEIDRSQNSDSKDKSISPPLNPKKEEILAGSLSSSQSSTPGSLTTRIIDTFKNRKGSCPRRSCKQSCTSSNAQYAGDSSWCSKMPTPAPVPTSCKEPSLTERLRRRSGTSCSKPCGSRHRLHTKTCVGKTSETKVNTENVQMDSNINKLETILHERSQLKEAGLGRVIVTQQQIKETNTLSGGLMELKIPPSSDSVRVRVSLNFENSKSTICKSSLSSHPHISQNSCSSSNDSGRPWLSIKNLQKKFTCGQKQESQQLSEKPTVLGTCTPRPRSNCGKEATKEPCRPKGNFGKVSARENSKSQVPQTNGPPKSTCGGKSRQDPLRCSFKQDFLNVTI